MKIKNNYLCVSIEKKIYILRCDSNEIFVLDDKYGRFLNGKEKSDPYIENELVEAGVLEYESRH